MKLVLDESKVEDFLKVFEDLVKYRVEIGIFSDAGADILMIANVHEFGCNIQVTERMRNYLHTIGIHLKKDTTSINIPERSFMRAGYDSEQKKIQKQIEKLLEKVLQLELPVNSFFEAMGEICTSSLKQYMTQLSSPANSRVTVAQKGSNNPLIDTGRLRDSITYKVVS